MEIREDVNRHREIEAEVLAFGYEHAWQQRLWRVLRDSLYITDLRPNIHQEDQLAEEPSAPSPGKEAPHRRAATLGDFMKLA